MRKRIANRSKADAFIDSVIKNSSHAPEFHGPVMAIYDEMIGRINFDRDELRVLVRNGETKRATWLTLDGVDMVFAFNYKVRRIELRESNVRGEVVASFNSGERRESIVKELNRGLKKLGVA